MNPFAQGTSGGGGSNNPFAPSSSGGVDLNTSQGLLELARAQGGAVGQLAEELAHPNRGILSSIGNGFKKAFSEFVDIISVPNQVVAGVLSDKYSVSEAVKKNISTSDVIFGEQDPNATTMKKVGSFLVRTATDIVLDPLTYVTFGASRGVLGISSLQKIQLGEKAAGALGKQAFQKVALSENIGEGIYKYLTAQAKGTAKAEELFLGLTNMGDDVAKVANAAKKELEDIMIKETIDAPLNKDFARKAITNLLETNPAFASTLLDKGGIKVLGKSILSGQRIAAAMRMIPGMTLIDNATQPFRLALQAPFDSTIRKNLKTGEYVRLPQEFVDGQIFMQRIAEARKDEAFKNLDAIVKQNNLSIAEAKTLSDNLLSGTIPADERLANVYKQALGFNENELKWLQESGVPIARNDFFGMPLVRTDVEDIAFNPQSSSLSKKAGASYERTTGKFINPVTGEELVGTPESLKLVKKNTEEEITKIISSAEKNITEKGMKIESITKEIERLSMFVDEAFKGKVVGEFSKVIDALPVADRENARQFINVLKDSLDTLDVDKLTKGFAEATMDSGVKLKETLVSEMDKMSPEALDRLKDKIAKGEMQLADDINIVNEALSEAKPNINKTLNKASGEGVEDEIAQLAKRLKTQSSARRFAEIGEKIDKEALMKFINTIQTQFEANPTGVRKMLNQIIGDKQQIIDLVNEIDLEKTIAKQNISELPNAKMFFTNEEGQIFERFNATMTELKEAGFKFEDNAIIAQAIRATENAKVGASRRFLRDTAETFGRVKSEAHNGWRPINMTNLGEESEKILQIMGKEGEEMYFHPMIAQELESGIKAVISDDATKDFLKAYDKIQNLWKAGVTSIFPAFHGRNALSNVFQNFLDIGFHALNPANHAASSQMIYYDKQLNKLEKIAYGGTDEVMEKLDEISQEARKYKSAEEFVKAQGQSVFRGGDTAIDTSRGGGRGISVSDKETAGLFTPPKGGVVDEAILPKTAKILKEGDIPKNLQDAYIKEAEVLADPNNFSSTLQKSVIEKQQAIIDYARKNGFDAVEFPFEKEIRVIKPNILKTKSQLTDIWNKANKATFTSKAKDAMNEILNREMFTDATGYKWTIGEIRQTLKERGIAFRGGTGQIDVFDPQSVDEFTESLFGAAGAKQKAKNLAKKALPTSQDFAPFAAGRAVGSAIEDQAKVLNFMVNLRATGDVSHAAARTNMFLFDYQNLTKFEKTFVKRLIPFYTFTRKNLELQAKVLASTPGRIAAEVKALTNVGEAMAGAELTDEERAKLPAWLQSGIGILKSRKGSTLEMFSSLGTPLEQPLAAFQPNQFLGSVSPLIRVPIETATGYSWFQGKALSDATNAAAYKNAPKALKDLIGYTELTGKRKDGTEFKWSVALRPEMMNTINNLPLFGRVLSSLKQMEDVDVSTQGKILQQLIGVKAYSINLEDEANKREAELEKKLKELLTKAGVTAQFTRTYIPKNK